MYTTVNVLHISSYLVCHITNRYFENSFIIQSVVVDKEGGGNLWFNLFKTDLALQCFVFHFGIIH